MASPPNFPKFGPTRATQPTAAQSGAGTGQLSPEEKAKVELMRQELVKNGITPEIQARFRMRAEKSGLWVVPGSSVDTVPTSEPQKQDATAPAPAPTQPGEPPKLDFAKFANDERARLQDKIEQLKKDPKYAWLTRRALGPDILQKAFSQAGTSTNSTSPTAASAGAASSKPWAAADWVQQKPQGFQRDTKLAQALSPKPKERPYRLNIKGDKVQSMQLPGYTQSQPPSTPQASVAPAPAATAQPATTAPRAKSPPRAKPQVVSKTVTTKTKLRPSR